MKKLSIFCSLALVLALMAEPVCAQAPQIWMDIDGDGVADDCAGASMMVNGTTTVDVYLNMIPQINIIAVRYMFHWSGECDVQSAPVPCLRVGSTCVGWWDAAAQNKINHTYNCSLFDGYAGVPPDPAIALHRFEVTCTGFGTCEITIDNADVLDWLGTGEYYPDDVGCTINQTDLCEIYYEKYLTCVDLRDVQGREVDYDVCKVIQDEGDCMAAGCTWHNAPSAFPCMLDMCLMDWDGQYGVGIMEFAIFKREQGRGPCPTTHQAEDDLCQMYNNKYQICIEKRNDNRELDYNVCSAIHDAGDCAAAGCTWYNAPSAFPCMLDICLMDWDGINGVGLMDFAIFKREQGRGSCPCSP